MKRKALAMVMIVALSGCSFAPTYQPTTITTPPAFKEQGPWTQGEPADQLARGSWWQLFNDSTLNQLEQTAATANPTLTAALAHYDAAHAALIATRSGLFPDISAGASANRSRQSANRPLRSASQPNVYDADTVGLSADYEVDLWGSVRNSVDAGTAGTQAAAADLENVRLSLQAELAVDYFQLRGLDSQARLLQDTVSDYAKALQLTQLRHEGGIASGIDVGRAQTQLDSARAEVQDVAARRARYEHAIAALVGESASSFTLPAAIVVIRLPTIPVGVPSTLLQRRPDIAAAERRAAAANAEIGVARAAFFPVLSIDATGGYQSTSVSHWLSAPDSFWSFGPSALINVFDAGLHKAQVAEARARYTEASAEYRGKVLAAFSEVEDNLSLLGDYAKEANELRAATQAAEQTEALAMDRYREGVVNYLEVVTAQTTALQAERDDIVISTQRLQASVGLIRAIGGGWSTADMPSADLLSKQSVAPTPSN